MPIESRIIFGIVDSIEETILSFELLLAHLSCLLDEEYFFFDSRKRDARISVYEK